MSDLVPLFRGRVLLPRTFGITFSEWVAVVYLESMFRPDRDTTMYLQLKDKIL